MQVIVYTSLNRNIAVQLRRSRSVEAYAVSLGRVAAARLSQHRKTGRHFIVVEKANRIDYNVSLFGPHAVAIEMGHVHDGKWVEGIHVLRNLNV